MFFLGNLYEFLALGFGRGISTGIDFLAVLRALASHRSPGSANPMTFADRVGADRDGPDR